MHSYLVWLLMQHWLIKRVWTWLFFLFALLFVDPRYKKNSENMKLESNRWYPKYSTKCNTISFLYTVIWIYDWGAIHKQDWVALLDLICCLYCPHPNSHIYTGCTCSGFMIKSCSVIFFLIYTLISINRHCVIHSMSCIFSKELNSSE